jgi:hypothetical protein
VTTSHNGSDTVTSKASPSGAQSFFITIIVHPRVRFHCIHNCTGAAGKGDVMSIFSNKSSAFALAAAVIATVSMTSFSASAGPFFKPGPCKPGQLIGCTGTSPGNNNHWNGGGYGGFSGGLSINLAQPVAADEGDCYYVRRKVFIPQVGVVSKRELVCN